jgi:hypothetical protein
MGGYSLRQFNQYSRGLTMELAHHSRNLLLLPLLSRGGLVAWLLLLIVLPAGLVERLFLAGPLLLVPMLLSLLPDRPVVRRVGTRDLAAWSFVAAGPLGAALILPPSPAAAGLALGWIAVVLVCGLVALRHGLPLLPRLFVPSRAHELAGYAALGFVAVAGAFLLADRLGLSVLGFRSPYTLLGAVHYTFAGFGLLASVAVLAGDAPSRRHWLAALGVIGGMTITAMGMIVGGRTRQLGRRRRTGWCRRRGDHRRPRFSV